MCRARELEWALGRLFLERGGGLREGLARPYVKGKLYYRAIVVDKIH